MHSHGKSTARGTTRDRREGGSVKIQKIMDGVSITQNGTANPRLECLARARIPMGRKRLSVKEPHSQSVAIGAAYGWNVSYTVFSEEGVT